MEAAVENFKAFVRIPSVAQEGPTNGSYRACVEFLRGLLLQLPGIAVKEVEYVKDKPILLGTLLGQNPALPSVLLNSHYDVVPAVRAKWTVDPFSAMQDEKGNIYGRGTQDMKCVCIQYIECLRRLLSQGKTFLRTIHLSFVPDEEMGGLDGMAKFVETDDFKSLNVGFAMDEGLASPTEQMTMFHGERSVNWLKIRAVGNAGHGSRFIENTAAQKLVRSIQHFLTFRSEQEAQMHTCNKHLGDVATINLTMMKGGVSADGQTFALNVIPTEAEAGFDIRVPPSIPMEEFEAKLQEWTSEDGVSLDFLVKTPQHAVTTLDPSKNGWWPVFSAACTAANVQLDPRIFPAATDSRYLRALGYPAFGFSPINHTTILLHDHDEYLNEGVFLKGITIYEHIIPALADAGSHVTYQP
eukprot:gnl/Hemi2/21625_TR7208_c0_g1_i1.p1 gnl/Hemi2/21625_TR7208_c0_g1~~gnl/Hemi2/21625_TR7208_c0_g1_i1.p1  ORF type:complete len:453 (+),score=139.05 gnl/Hemi2/21625_TR7208_c0_g1_i1:126-1361(+)